MGEGTRRYVEDAAEHAETVRSEELVFRVQVLQERTHDDDDFFRGRLFRNLLDEQIRHAAQLGLRMRDPVETNILALEELRGSKENVRDLAAGERLSLDDDEVKHFGDENAAELGLLGNRI